MPQIYCSAFSHEVSSTHIQQLCLHNNIYIDVCLRDIHHSVGVEMSPCRNPGYFRVAVNM